MSNNIAFSYGKNPYEEEWVASQDGQIVQFPSQNDEINSTRQKVAFIPNRKEIDELQKNFLKREKLKSRIDNAPIKAYNNGKNENCEDNYMSIVGFFRCRDGVLAFGDTKGTILNIYHDKARGEIRKVFQNDHLMLVTYGNNKVKQRNLEDVLDEIICKNVSLDATTADIQNNVFEKSLSDYNFCFYDKDTDVIISCSRTNDGTFYNRIDGDNVYFGDADYVNYLNILTRYNVTYKKTDDDKIVLLTVDEMKKRLDDALTFLIKTLDDSLSYNTVGLPILFEEYFFKK